ncbi:MAG: CotH kinase family protein, partial [bacterium]
LYLNGLYWGLYNPVERPEAGFGEEYFGGDDEDYDAINRRTVTNEAVDGTLEAYNELLRRADEDLTASYAAVEDMLDVDDLIDYMLIHQYTVNRDGPCCAESNNMRGLRKREDGAQ